MAAATCSNIYISQAESEACQGDFAYGTRSRTHLLTSQIVKDEDLAIDNSISANLCKTRHFLGKTPSTKSIGELADQSEGLFYLQNDGEMASEIAHVGLECGGEQWNSNGDDDCGFYGLVSSNHRNEGLRPIYQGQVS